MCRNIKRLRQPDRLPNDAELHEAAVEEVAAASHRMFERLDVRRFHARRIAG